MGVTLQEQGPIPGITPFFEGDDQATIDAENYPTTPWTLPNQQARAATDPDRLVFTPGWYIPIHFHT